MKILIPLAVLALSSALRAQDPCGVWSPVPIPDPPGATQTVVEDVKALGPDLAWAVGRQTAPVVGGSATKTVAWRWDGTSWTIVPTPSPSPFPEATWCELEAVEILSANDVWAAGTQRIVGPDGFLGNQVLVLHWNGAQWSIVPSPMTNGGSGNFVDDIEAISANDIWFVGDWLTFPPNSAARKEALAMHWNGSSFAILPAPFFDNAPIGGHGLTKVAAIASDDVWSVGGGHDGDYVSFSEIVHWNGSTWEYRPGPTPGWDHRLYAVEMIAHDDVWATGDYQDAAGYHVFFTHWDGSGWSMVDDDAPAGGGGLVAFGPDEVYSSGSGIARWDGASWSAVASFPSVFAPSLMALDAAGTPGTLWAVGREVVVDDLLTLATRLVSDGAWTTVPVAPAADAPAPLLLGAGMPVAGEMVSLTLAGAPVGKPVLLVLGAQAVMLPLKGSVLVPSPDALLPGLASGPTGSVTLQAAWPPGVPVGTSLYLQAWIHGPQAWIASDGLRALVP